MNSPHFQRFDPPHEPELETDSGLAVCWFLTFAIAFALGFGLAEFFGRVF